MVSPQNADEVVDEELLPQEVALVQVRKVTDRQVDVAALQSALDLAGRQAHRADRRARRRTMEMGEDPRKEHHLSHVRHREGGGKARGCRIEGSIGDEIVPYPVDQMLP